MPQTRATSDTRSRVFMDAYATFVGDPTISANYLRRIRSPLTRASEGSYIQGAGSPHTIAAD